MTKKEERINHFFKLARERAKGSEVEEILEDEHLYNFAKWFYTHEQEFGHQSDDDIYYSAYWFLWHMSVEEGLPTETLLEGAIFTDTDQGREYEKRYIKFAGENRYR